MKRNNKWEQAFVFVNHIQNHLKEMSKDEKRHEEVMCKICGKTITEIFNEE